jgi:hypothetical protein
MSLQSTASGSNETSLWSTIDDESVVSGISEVSETSSLRRYKMGYLPPEPQRLNVSSYLITNDDNNKNNDSSSSSSSSGSDTNDDDLSTLIEDDDEEESDVEVENKVIKRQKQDPDEDGIIVNNTKDIKKKQLYTLLSL